MTKASKPVPDIAYYDNGGVRYRGFQLDGEPHGAWEFLRKDGSVMRAGEFDHGTVDEEALGLCMGTGGIEVPA